VNAKGRINDMNKKAGELNQIYSSLLMFVVHQVLVSCPRTLEMGRRWNSPEEHCFELLCALTDQCSHQLVTKSDKSFLLFAAIRAKKTAISLYGTAMLTERTHIKYSDDIKIT